MFAVEWHYDKLVPKPPRVQVCFHPAMSFGGSYHLAIWSFPPELGEVLANATGSKGASYNNLALRFGGTRHCNCSLNIASRMRTWRRGVRSTNPAQASSRPYTHLRNTSLGASTSIPSFTFGCHHVQCPSSYPFRSLYPVNFPIHIDASKSLLIMDSYMVVTTDGPSMSNSVPPIMCISKSNRRMLSYSSTKMFRGATSR